LESELAADPTKDPPAPATVPTNIPVPKFSCQTFPCYTLFVTVDTEPLMAPPKAWLVAITAIVCAADFAKLAAIALPAAPAPPVIIPVAPPIAPSVARLAYEKSSLSLIPC